MQLYEKNINQVMFFMLYSVYNKHEMIKTGNQTRKNRKYYRKCLNTSIGANFEKFLEWPERQLSLYIYIYKLFYLINN